MAIYKRGKTWWVGFTAPSGERIRRSAGTREKDQAKEYHDRLKAELWRVHKLGEKPRRTWQEAVVRWRSEKDQKADIERDIGKLRWLHAYLGDRYLDEIDRTLVSEIAEVKRREASGATANRYLALIRAILRMARDEWEWVERVPCIRLYEERKRRIRWISREEANRLLGELPPHLADMAAFTLATGLRQRNASYLRWSQIDLVRRQGWIHADEFKSRRALAVPLNADAMEVLERRYGEHEKFVFTYKGRPVARTSTRAWAQAKKRACIEDFRWHDLRHTWASWHVQNGTSLQELQELGGWSSFEMVLRYAHLAADHLRDAARRVEGTELARPSL